jgi:hypothetical protein
MRSLARLGELNGLSYFARLHLHESHKRNHPAIDQRGDHAENEDEAEQAWQT